MEIQARNITWQMEQASSVKGLLSAHRSHEKHLSDNHLRACWTSLGRLARRGPAERRCLQTHAQALEPLVRHTARAAWVGDTGTRQLGANVAYGAALSGMVASLRLLFAALARALGRHVGSINAQ